mmetsp:Transcript_7838/g.23493  ORF Transcript_7838/g.23493 Transcript_7838/m.23493 type:complete len:345 (-) Transcript_7838:587-1621(-)
MSRLLGGVAYSILFTSFEAWLVAEAEACRLPSQLLTEMFATSSFVYAVSAVVAGVVGHFCIALLTPPRGPSPLSAPFNLAVPVLLAASALCQWTWREHYGDRSASPAASLWRSWRTVTSSRTLLCLGLINALYETALYVFVFMWTPSLELRAPRAIPHGLVFSSFMVCKMAGAQLFYVLADILTPIGCLGMVFAGSAVCMAVPIFSRSYEALLVAFALFEGLLGIYWPAIALLRVGEIADAERASTMAVFRVLLNGLVIAVLLAAGAMPEHLVYATAAAALLVCFGATRVLAKEARPTSKELSPIVAKTGLGNSGARDTLPMRRASSGEGLPADDATSRRKVGS